MDSRKVKICYFLVKNKNVFLNEIASEFNKSERTIRNDIEEINYFLKKKNIRKIDIENNTVNFDVNPFEIYKVLNNLSYSEYYLDSIERRVVIILFGLLKKDYFTINELVDFMHMSRSTVISDLDSIKKFIRSFNYNLISEPSIGTLIKENRNSKKSELIRELIDFDINNISRFFNQDVLSGINSNLRSDYITNISNLIKNVENQTDTKLTEYSFRLLKYYISIYIQTVENTNIKLEDIPISDFTELLLKNLSRNYQIRFTKNEEKDFIEFINKLNFSKKIYDSKDKLKAQIVTDNFIKKVSSKLNIDFTKDDELLKNLSNHLSDIIDNPIIKIKEYTNLTVYANKFPEIKRAIINSLDTIKIFIDRELNDIEINFIIIYFIAALERMKNQVNNIKILLICPHGVSTSFLVKENLKSIIPNCEIELANSQNYLKKKKELSPDLIFSTVKIEKNIDYLLINPILDFDSTTDILREIDKVKMKKIITRERDNGKKIKDIKVNKGFTLSELLTKDRIKCNIEASDWKEAIVKSADILIKDKIIEQKYVNSMIKNVEDYGPYIIISKGVALPHASSESNVNKTGMSLIKLRTPVKFEGSDEEINIFICLASVNNEHFNAFISLINGLRKKEFRELLNNADDEEEIFKIILDMENWRS
ncbi:PTS transporter subunit EIIA [Helcococcus kunzii]|uniref:BglG family transcription antiterminator n=1 Tax=Helcococcus kunzii TaxID=40091 RepID=UPI001BB0D3A9|nr:PTS sugar transporter subunit IIA [Helcococcus kunzii]QUY64039.1 PTS transporter subunit EIIA [Helcococcus kunzii]